MIAGQRYLTGVYDVNEDDGQFTLFTPRVMGDDTSRTRFSLHDVVSISVTDVDWRT